MLSIFPDLLTYGLAGPALLRIVAGLIVISFGYQLYRKITTPKPISAQLIALFEIVIGIFLIIGLFTQPASLIAIVILFIQKFNSLKPQWAGAPIYSKQVYVLLSVILLSLLITGPGFLAFDLPL